MTDLAGRVAALRANYNDCFGCGLDNPIGLHLDGFAIAEDELRAQFTPRPDYVGITGILHGGIVATLLDETLAWTAMLLENTMVVTANLDLRYRKPAPTNSSYSVRGRVDERRGRRLRLSGSVHNGDTLVAEAGGLFVATDPIAP